MYRLEFFFELRFFDRVLALLVLLVGFFDELLSCLDLLDVSLSFRIYWGKNFDNFFFFYSQTTVLEIETKNRAQTTNEAPKTA